MPETFEAFDGTKGWSHEPTEEELKNEKTKQEEANKNMEDQIQRRSEEIGNKQPRTRELITDLRGLFEDEGFDEDEKAPDPGEIAG